MKVSPSLLALAAVLLPSAPGWSSVSSIDWKGIICNGDEATGMLGLSASQAGETVHLIFDEKTK